jgi:tetratricopeptide (TPR) repeat protein
MGRIKQEVDFDWAGADASFQRAVALDPGNPEVVRTAAFPAAMLGRFDEALQLTRRAVDLDPLNADSWEGLAETKFFMGQLDEAAADSKKALELNPDVVAAHWVLSQIYVIQGRPQDALPEIELVRYDAYRAFLYPIEDYPESARTRRLFRGSLVEVSEPEGHPVTAGKHCAGGRLCNVQYQLGSC